jgi:hypothetical protein
MNIHFEKIKRLRHENAQTLKSNPKKYIRISLGNFIRHVGMRIAGKYWICTECRNVEFYEREVRCWKCGTGEMIYQGRI